MTATMPAWAFAALLGFLLVGMLGIAIGCGEPVTVIDGREYCVDCWTRGQCRAWERRADGTCHVEDAPAWGTR